MKKTTSKKKKPLKRYVSALALAHLEQQLKIHPPDFSYIKDYFIFYLDIFYRLETNNKDLWYKEESGYIATSSNYFKSVIKDGSYAKHRNYLGQIGILHIDFCYKDNEAMGYSYNPAFEGPLIHIEIAPESLLWKQIIAQSNKKRSHKAKESFFKIMEKKFKQIKFDLPAARDFLDKQKELGFIDQSIYNGRLVALNRFSDKDFFFSRNDTNYRIDSNLTNLKRELKNFIVGDYICIDLKNSQPFLLNLIINLYNQVYTSSHLPNPMSFCGENNKYKPLKPLIDKLLQPIEKRPLLNRDEVDIWLKTTKNGTIYELFMQQLNIDRTQAKELFICVLYSPNSSQNYVEYRKKFKSVFPTIHKLLQQIKSVDYKDLSISMQRIESFLFIDCVSKRLVEEGIIPFTVHDSLIIKKERLVQTKKIIDEIFLEVFDVVPSFEVKELKPDSEEILKALTQKPKEKLKKKKIRFCEKEYQNYRQKLEEESEVALNYEFTLDALELKYFRELA